MPIPLSRSFISPPPPDEEIRVPHNGIFELKFTYDCPDRVRNAVSSMMFRASTDAVRSTARMPPGSITGIGTAASTVTTVDPADIVLLPVAFFNYVFENLVTYMCDIQSEDVVYRRVECNVYSGVTWGAGGTGAPTTVSIGTSPDKMVLSSRHRYKAGLITGRSLGGSSNHKALAYLMYGANMSSYGDKPSRFLVSGTTLQSFTETASSPAVNSIADFLSTPIQLVITNAPSAASTASSSGSTSGSTPATHQVEISPIVMVGGEFRHVVTIQLEGLSNVAGSGKLRAKSP